METLSLKGFSDIMSTAIGKQHDALKSRLINAQSAEGQMSIADTMALQQDVSTLNLNVTMQTNMMSSMAEMIKQALEKIR
jgi:hypothetical protein